MENYQRRKLYRIHLKNISEIKNCRSPKSNIAYPSRLFNFDLGVSQSNNGRQTAKQRSPRKIVLANIKRSEENFLRNYQLQKQNIRLSSRLVNTNGSISMFKYEKQYTEHRKLMKMHRRVKQKRIIMYRIHDIMFKGVTPDLTEVFCIYDITRKKIKDKCLKTRRKLNNFCENQCQISNLKHNQQISNLKYNQHPNNITGDRENNCPNLQIPQQTKHVSQSIYSNRCKCDTITNQDVYHTTKNSRHQNATQRPELLLSGNIFQLRKSMIKGFRDQKIRLKIIGRTSGQVVLQQIQMVPIMHNKQVAGSLIVQMC